jgi:hypothetical protein
MLVRVIAYGLIRSLAMLNVTLESYLQHRPRGAHVELVAYCYCPYGNQADAENMLLAAGAAFVYLEPPNATTLPTCRTRQQRVEHANELAAARLAEDASDDALFGYVSVLWRIDTRLVSPVDVARTAPWLHPWRVYVPRTQAGAGLNDRFEYGAANAVHALALRRLEMLEAACLYGEPQLLAAVRALVMEVGFTSTRVVRVRADLSVPDVDRALVLHTIPPRGWMRGMNRFPNASVLRCTHDVCTPSYINQTA